jgi:hypothetical protein
MLINPDIFFFNPIILLKISFYSASDAVEYSLLGADFEHNQFEGLLRHSSAIWRMTSF